MEVPLAEDRTMAESINGSMATCTDISLSHGPRGGETEREREGGVIKKSPTKALYEYTKGKK